jgi:hypothetical protein
VSVAAVVACSFTFVFAVLGPGPDIQPKERDVAVKLSQLIAEYGDESVQFQNLDHCATDLNMKGGTTKITFGTEQPISIEGTSKLGLVVWLDRTRVKEILASLKAAKP